MKAPFLDAYFFYCENSHLKEIFTQVIKHDSIKFFNEATNLLDLILINDLPSSEETIGKIEHFNLRFPSVPLVVLTQHFTNPFYLEKIFQHPVKFSLPKDLTKQEALAFFTFWSQEINTLKEEPGPLPEDLISQYAQNIFLKFMLFYDIEQEVSPSNYKEKLAFMSNEAHKIVGSAGSFGYAALGDIARQLDHYLLNILQNEKIQFADFKHQINAFMRRLLLAYQKIPVS